MVHLEFRRTAGRRVRLSCPLMLFFHIIGLSERSSVPGHCMVWTCERCCSNLALCEVLRTLHILVLVDFKLLIRVCLHCSNWPRSCQDCTIQYMVRGKQTGLQ